MRLPDYKFENIWACSRKLDCFRRLWRLFGFHFGLSRILALRRASRWRYSSRLCVMELSELLPGNLDGCVNSFGRYRFRGVETKC